MSDIRIVKVTPMDLEQLKNISIKTFTDTFSAANSDENMQLYVNENFSTTRLTEELNDSDAAFYFAKHNDEITGYLKLNSGHAQTELRDIHALEIERIYVIAEYQGKGVAQLLFNKAIEVGLAKKAAYIWLGVWEENHRAIQFYKKNGFTEFDKHIFRLGNDEQTDLMMKLMLEDMIKSA